MKPSTRCALRAFWKVQAAFCLALPFVAACSDIMGFQDGKPWPVEADASGDSSPSRSEAGVDASQTSDSGTGLDAQTDALGAETEAGGCSLTHCGSACVDTSLDPKNCGACGHDCTALMHIGSTTGVSCAAGKCLIAPSACAQGYAHCTVNADDGCETDITAPAHCSGCTTTCPASMPLCTATGCTLSCPGALSQCGGSCANLDSDPAHCGNCQTPCPAPPSGGTATCTSRTCGVQCLAGYHQCGTTAQCASDTDATRCGAACANCPGTANGDPACTNNACSVVCRVGYHMCGGGCVSDTDATQCGTSCTNCQGTLCYQGACSACAPNPSPTGCASTTPQFCNAVGQWQNVASGACGGASTCVNGTCICSATMCPSGCADVNSDGRNCGTCGHDCQGGACQLGNCQPVVLASGQDLPTELAVDANNIYWVNGSANGSVMKRPLAGNAAPTQLQGGQVFPVGIAVDAANVFWLTSYADSQRIPDTGILSKVPIGGGAITPLAAAQRSPVGLVIAGGYLCWGTSSTATGGSLETLPIGGGVQISRDLSQGTQAVTGDGANVYVAYNRTMSTVGFIFKIPLDGSPVITLSSSELHPSGIAVYGTNVYWTDNGNGSARTVAIAGGTAATQASSLNNPRGIAVDASGVYVTDLGNGAISRVQNGVSVNLALGQIQPYAIALDVGTVYWVNRAAGADGAVMKVAK